MNLCAKLQSIVSKKFLSLQQQEKQRVCHAVLEFKESILSGVCDYSVFYIERSTDADFALGTYLVGKV